MKKKVFENKSICAGHIRAVRACAEGKQAKNYHFHTEWEEDYFLVYSHSKPVCLICNATVAFAKKGNLERHFKTVHGRYERDFPAETPLHATKVRDLKAQLAARQSIFT